MMKQSLALINNAAQGGAAFASGISQFHTNEPGKDNRKPYLAIDMVGIKKLVDTPQQVDKTQAQWLIPSTYPSRNFKEQEANGEYWLLWADLDKTPPALPVLCGMVNDMLAGHDFELYNSRSATPDNQKARLLIFLGKPLCYAGWNLAQEVLNDNLEALGIIPDRANERAAQLCYLPNKGVLYGSESIRNNRYFDPVSFWADEIAAKREKLESDRLALEAAQRTTMAKKAALNPSTYGFDALKAAFNEAYTPQEWMLQAGYSQRGNSFCHPNSGSGSYSATVKGGRVNALSTNDPLYTDGNGAHDAFSVYTTLFHGGDINAALKAAGNDLLAIGCVSWNKAAQREWGKAQEQAKQPPVVDKPLVWEKPSYKIILNSDLAKLNVLDDDSHYCTVDFLKHIDDDHLLKKLSLSVSRATHVPAHTVFMAGLGVFSSISSRLYRVSYRFGGSIPIGIYTVLEQPPGTAKTWSLSSFQKPFYEEQAEINNSLVGDETAKKIRLFTTNATAEAMEARLADSGGYFSGVSSEQGLFNTLLGSCYNGDRVSNNDLVLNGFDGEYMASDRISRVGYTGSVVGNIVLFAQPGSIDGLLRSSNGTGLFERFMMLAERHNLGKRDHTRQVPIDHVLIAEYNARCKPMCREALTNIRPPTELPCLEISTAGWNMITAYQNSIEKHLADGGKYSHSAIRGAASKINMQIMKISANLHLIEMPDAVSIDDAIVRASIGVADEMLSAAFKLCVDKGIIGVRAEFESILSLFESSKAPRPERIIIQSKAQTKPFKDYTGNKSEKIREALRDMVRCGLLQVSYSSDAKPVLQYSPG